MAPAELRERFISITDEYSESIFFNAEDAHNMNIIRIYSKLCAYLASNISELGVFKKVRNAHAKKS